ncbi:hemerythrin domain-containing protein [Bailinhaonella thermotolerans]|uniref:Hemerythrin domain-containing protein n=2 Tax=Bailinhaonella thermotolerans TaxID=1070861 RepID=A0A3A4AZX5_9ACTN|nr:hemerythrin domain-containing protein [Bailinhaonella thermotolerans]
MIMADHREMERLFEVLRTRPEERELTLPVVAALLVAHSRAEEAEVYPALRGQAGQGGEVAHGQEEHLEAERRLQALREADPKGAGFEKALQAFVEAVQHHVEEEETTLLPAMRERLEAGELASLGEAFARSRAEHLGEMPGEAGREELLRQARNAGIEGASSMTKDELRRALKI